jgi:hypothetical protein
MTVPKVLEKMVDIVLAYRPPERQKPPRKRKKASKRQTGETKKKRESSI